MIHYVIKYSPTYGSARFIDVPKEKNYHDSPFENVAIITYEWLMKPGIFPATCHSFAGLSPQFTYYFCTDWKINDNLTYYYNRQYHILTLRKRYAQ